MKPRFNSQSQKGLTLKTMILLLLSLFALNSDVQAGDSIPRGLRISILTCGTGPDLYSIYGHSAVRVIDSLRETDIVYNYGTFNFSDPDFYMKFTRGKLLYYVNDEVFSDFVSLYQAEGRSVYEQVLALHAADALKVQDFLLQNIKPENKYYRYDFLFDNCSTRIRDIFTGLFGKRFAYGPAITSDSISFRTLLDFYERNLHWERFGINLLMSHRVDEKMSSEQSMFLPDYLMKGFRGAQLDGRPVVAETLQLLPEPAIAKDVPNEPRLIFWGLLLMLVLLSFVPALKAPLLLFDVLFFMLLGLLGCLMLFMWFGTEHEVCAWNRNLLWAFPLHLVFAFLLPRKLELAANYARYASALLVLSMIYGLFAEQKYMPELTPLLLLTLFRLSRYSRNAGRLAFRTFKA